MVTAYLIFLSLVAAERLVELRLSNRNARWALAQGGVEVGRGHFRAMTGLHVGLFAGCVLEVSLVERPFFPALGASMLALALAAQGLRYWAIASLGPRWNVRVIVVPGAPAVTSGPYRWLRHPNYLAVVLEGVALPLIHSAFWTAAVFTLLNAWLLSVRIRTEENALREHCDYDARLGDRPRLWPGRAGVSP